MKHENKKNFISNRFGSMCAIAKAGCGEEFNFKPTLIHKSDITWEWLISGKM